MFNCSYFIITLSDYDRPKSKMHTVEILQKVTSLVKGKNDES